MFKAKLCHIQASDGALSIGSLLGISDTLTYVRVFYGGSANLFLGDSTVSSSNWGQLINVSNGTVREFVLNCNDRVDFCNEIFLVTDHVGGFDFAIMAY